MILAPPPKNMGRMRGRGHLCAGKGEFSLRAKSFLGRGPHRPTRGPMTGRDRSGAFDELPTKSHRTEFCGTRTNASDTANPPPLLSCYHPRAVSDQRGGHKKGQPAVSGRGVGMQQLGGGVFRTPSDTSGCNSQPQRVDTGLRPWPLVFERDFVPLASVREVSSLIL